MYKVQLVSKELLQEASPCPICGSFPVLEVRNNKQSGTVEKRCQCSNENCVHLKTTWRATEKEAVSSWNNTSRYKNSVFKQFQSIRKAKKNNNGITSRG